ncbi:unknown [Alphamesonivirus casuarinaense]|uniref:Uncharacterized protein n=1 Tax=Alphamesonivirus casuarinaense TaxID=1945562 RepID=M4JTN4_9NIDO|nr:unknown [Alphamesonivirus 4]AGE00069.1 unknown [Alphamesonivirus 4]
MLDLVVGRKYSAHVYVSGLGPNRRFLYIRYARPGTSRTFKLNNITLEESSPLNENNV